MRLNEIRSKYIEYFKREKHTVIPSSSIVPSNDATTLFTGSGMQPLMPYLLGVDHPMGKRLVNSQKCFRAEDIEEVGDNRHTTFFEMLGNWSLGDYFKKEQLGWFYNFLTKEIGLNPERLYVTVFIGDEKNGIPKDTEAGALWKELFEQDGVDAREIDLCDEENAGKLGMQDGRIFYFDAEKNWWSRAGKPDNMPAGEPGGPDSEVFYDFEIPHDNAYGEHCHPNCDCGRFMEIGNNVFMQYLKQSDGSFKELPQKNIDFGGGLERIAAASVQSADVFASDVFQETIEWLEEVSGKKYLDETYQKSFRIIADHIRGAVFMIADGVIPSNTDAGYFTRRLIRRAVRHLDILEGPPNALGNIVYKIVSLYGEHYTDLKTEQENIKKIIQTEEEKFRKTLHTGQKELDKLILGDKKIDGKAAFMLFTTHGFPVELVEEIAKERGVSVDISEFEKEMQEHQALSRKGAEQKFKGGLADGGEQTTMLHTATHLMLAGLRKFLGDHVHQAGSNITTERTRFDFTNEGKVERDVLDKVEDYVNKAIKAEADVVMEKMSKEEAQKAEVEGSFWEKYPDIVNVYMVKGSDGTIFSKELCGGPHVKNTRDIKGVFKIGKEKASSAGVRRIKAVLE